MFLGSRLPSAELNNPGRYRLMRFKIAWLPATLCMCCPSPENTCPYKFPDDGTVGMPGTCTCMHQIVHHQSDLKHGVGPTTLCCIHCVCVGAAPEEVHAKRATHRALFATKVINLLHFI